jgi:hypothetical protein
MKITITNKALKVYHFSFCIGGRVHTLAVPPGSVAVNDEQLAELRKIPTFNTLEKDHILDVIGIKVEPKTSSPAPKVEPKVEPKVGPKKSKKKTKKSESTKMDLESL